MIYHGEKKISKVFHGDREISRVYRGNKLVFQNRLIPGVDYEKFQWLIADLYAIINSKTQMEIGNILKIKFDISSSTTRYQGFSEPWVATQTTQGGYLCSDDVDGRSTFIIRRYGTSLLRTANRDIYITNKMLSNPCYIEDAADYYQVNQERFDGASKNVDSSTIYLFGTANKNTERPRKYYRFDNTKIGLFEIEGKISLSPIKLTRNIAASVSADNRPHPAGECGMIDEISGKFYGNANSAGAFSVSNE